MKVKSLTFDRRQLCDVIAKWESAYLKHMQHRNKSDRDQTLKLTYKNRSVLVGLWKPLFIRFSARLYFKSLAKSETEREKILLVYQINEEIIHGRFPLNRDLAVELASLIAQIEFGDFRSAGDFTLTHRRTSSGRTTPPHTQQQIATVIERFYPQRFRDVSQDDMRLERWLSCFFLIVSFAKVCGGRDYREVGGVTGQKPPRLRSHLFDGCPQVAVLWG